MPSTVQNLQNTTAQIVGLIPFFISIVIFIFSKRWQIVFAKLLSDLLWALHFVLLGEFVGAAINIVNTVRGCVFLYRGKKKWASHRSVPIIFITLTVFVTLIRWQGWFSILPMVGSVLAVIGFWCASPEEIRRFNLPAVILWLIYGILIGSVSTVLSNTFSIVSIVISEIRAYLRKRKDRLIEP